jgi:hypothetical protein
VGRRGRIATFKSATTKYSGAPQNIVRSSHESLSKSIAATEPDWAQERVGDERRREKAGREYETRRRRGTGEKTKCEEGTKGEVGKIK